MVIADVEKLAEIFKLFSDKARVRIVQVLKRRAMCVTELTSQLSITTLATCQHAGKTYYFCTDVCQGKFETEPKKYTGKWPH